MSFPLAIDDHVSAALNVFALAADAFSEGDVAAIGRHVAQSVATITNMRSYTRAVDVADGLRAAIEARAVIEQAKGMIMLHRRCTAAEAFVVLSQHSQQTNRKVRDLAGDIVKGAVPIPASPAEGGPYATAAVDLPAPSRSGLERSSVGSLSHRVRF